MDETFILVVNPWSGKFEVQARSQYGSVRTVGESHSLEDALKQGSSMLGQPLVLQLQRYNT